MTLILNEDLFLGEGTHRICYLHPQNPDLCVKILRRPDDKSDLRQMLRESGYCEKLYSRIPDIDFITRYFGKAQTNFGEGYLFELVKDFDGKISESLASFFYNEPLFEKNFDLIISALRVLRKKLHDNAIVLKNLHSVNLLLKRTSAQSAHFVIIDDIGTPVSIPLEYYFKFLARKKTARYWERYLIKNTAKTYNSACTLKLIKALKEINGPYR